MRKRFFLLAFLLSTFFVFSSSAWTAVPNNKIVFADPLCLPPPPGMIGWWSGDGEARDLANDFHGSLEEGINFASGKVDQAFALDGIDDYVRIPDGTSGLDGFGRLTIDAWINPDALQWPNQDTGGSTSAIVSKYNSTRADGIAYYFTLENSHLRLGIFQSHSPASWIIIESDDSIPSNEWHHVTGVWRGADQLELYVDGQLENASIFGQGPLPSLMEDNDVPVNIGRIESFSGSFVGPAALFHGLIDEVEIFNRDLTTDEIQAIFSAGSAGKCKTIEVDIDIRPGDFPNVIDPFSRKAVVVGILSSGEFDATAVDPLSVLFGPAGTMTKNGQFRLKDVNQDGLLDLALFFRQSESGIQCGDLTASLNGNTLEGEIIQGSDLIVTAGCNG